MSATSVARRGDEVLSVLDVTSVFGNQHLEHSFCCCTAEWPLQKWPRASSAWGNLLLVDAVQSLALLSRQFFVASRTGVICSL